MKYNLFSYSPLTYARITAEDGEMGMSGPEDESFGVVYVKGGMKILESTIPEQVGIVSNESGFVPRYPGVINYSTVGDTEWCCFNRNGTEERTLVYQEVNGSYTLSKDTGFIVISGSVSADGLIANQDDYFRPRTAECLVEGNAVLVLIS
jgi:hypothetical protein